MRPSAAVAFGGLLLALFFGTPRAPAFPWPGEARELEQTLRVGTVADRRSAVAQISRLSPAMAKRALELALADVDAEVRLAAARVAAELGEHDWGKDVLPWLSTADPRAQVAALTLIRVAPPTDSVPALGRLLASTDKQVRLQATEVLGRVSAVNAQEATQRLLEALEDPEPFVRGAATEALSRVGGTEVSLAVGLRLEDVDADVRSRAAVALGVLGEAGSERILLLALSDRESRVREAASESLGMLRLPSSAPGLLQEAERTPWGRSQATAVRALGRLNSDSAARGLVRLLERNEAETAVLDAIEALGAVAHPALEACLNQAVGRQLLSCATAWIDLGGASKPVRDAVAPGRIGNLQALQVLGRSVTPDEDAVVFALERLVYDDDAVREAARRVLARVKQWVPALRGPLREAVRARGLATEERAETLGLLVGDDHPETRQLARSFLSASSPGLRGAAAAVLVRAGASAASATRWLADQELAVGVATALAHGLSDERAAKILERYAVEDAPTRAAMRAALSGLPANAAPVVVRALAKEQVAASGIEAEQLLAVLARLSAADGFLAGQARNGTLAVRRQLAQWAAWRADATLARILVDDADASVRALAIQSAGRWGTSLGDRLRPRERTRAERLAFASAILHAPPSVVPPDASPYMRQLGDRDGAIRAFSSGILAKYWPERWAEQAQNKLWTDPEPAVRRLAARALGRVTSDASSRALRYCVAHDPDPKVATECETAIAPAAVGAVARLAPGPARGLAPRTALGAAVGSGPGSATPAAGGAALSVVGRTASSPAVSRGFGPAQSEQPRADSGRAAALVPLRAPDGVTPARNTSVALLSQGVLHFAVTTPHGNLILPEPDAELVDPSLAF